MDLLRTFAWTTYETGIQDSSGAKQKYVLIFATEPYITPLFDTDQFAFAFLAVFNFKTISLYYKISQSSRSTGYNCIRECTGRQLFPNIIIIHIMSPNVMI